MEDRVSNLEKSADTDVVSNLKEKVRILSLQQEPSDSLILLTLDELSKVARKTCHEEADMFEELARQANRYSSKLDISGLCLSVLGGKASDAVSKAVSKYMKGKQQNEQSENKDKKNDAVQKREESPLVNLYPPIPQAQYVPPGSLQPPFFPFFNHGMQNFSPNYGSYRNARPTGFRPSYSGFRPRGACLWCNSTAHQIKDCEKMKLAKEKGN